jgi:hypothetical protein
MRKLAWRAAGGASPVTPAEVLSAGLLALEEVRMETAQMRQAHAHMGDQLENVRVELIAAQRDCQMLRDEIKALRPALARGNFLDQVCFGDADDKAQLLVYAREILAKEEG